MKHENSGLQGSSNSIFKENPYALGGAPPGMIMAKRCELRVMPQSAGTLRHGAFASDLQTYFQDKIHAKNNYK